MKNLLVPRNLNMRKFGKDATKIARILDYMYRFEMYRDQYGFPLKSKKPDFNKPVPINMEKLKEIVGPNPSRLMKMICRRGDRYHKPVEEVILQEKAPYQYKHRSGQYVFAEKYRVKAGHYTPPRFETADFQKRDRDKREKEIASFPENYLRVCRYIKMLSLEITVEQREELILRIKDEAIQREKEEWQEWHYLHIKKIFPHWPHEKIRNSAEGIWDHYEAETITEIEEENYDRLLFLEDKIREMDYEDEFPVYSRDRQGRLHYYLTNMSEELRPYIRLCGSKMVSYDLGTSQCVFIWICLCEYIRDENITPQELAKQADDIMETISECDNGKIPEYVIEGLTDLKHNLNTRTLDKEMNAFRKLLGRDFYADIMETINWKRRPDGEYDRKAFKSDVLFAFLYGKNLSWKQNKASSPKSVGGFRFGQFSKCMIQNGFQSFEGSKTIAFSHGQFHLVVETFHRAA